MTKLTTAQAETLFVLLNNSYGDDIPFTAHQAFPERNNRHNAMRRTCKTLASKGILREVQVYGDSRLEPGYQFTDKAREAFAEWAQQHDYDFSAFDPY